MAGGRGLGGRGTGIGCKEYSDPSHPEEMIIPTLRLCHCLV